MFWKTCRKEIQPVSLYAMQYGLRKQFKALSCYTRVYTSSGYEIDLWQEQQFYSIPHTNSSTYISECKYQT